jgi:hypothetical protein
VRETSCLVAFYWANFLGKVLGNFLQVVAVFVNWTKKRKSEKAKKRKNEKTKKRKSEKGEKGDGFIFPTKGWENKSVPLSLISRPLISPCKPDG